MQNGTNRYTSSLHSTQLVAKMKLKNPSLQHEKPKWSAYRVIEPKLHPMLLLVTVQVEVSFCRKMNTNHNKKYIYIYNNNHHNHQSNKKHTHIFRRIKTQSSFIQPTSPTTPWFLLFLLDSVPSTPNFDQWRPVNHVNCGVGGAGEFTVDSLTWKGIFVGRWSSGFILFLLIYICIYPPGN